MDEREEVEERRKGAVRLFLVRCLMGVLVFWSASEVCAGAVAACSPLTLPLSAFEWARLAVWGAVLTAAWGWGLGWRWAWAALTGFFVVLMPLCVVRGLNVPLEETWVPLGQGILYFYCARALVRTRAPGRRFQSPLLVPAVLTSVALAETLLPLFLGGLAPTRLESLSPGEGELTALAGQPRWSGFRSRLAWDVDGPWKEELEPWVLVLVPSEDRFRIQGLHLSPDVPVEVDPARNALLVGDVVFAGERVEGELDRLEDSPSYVGVRFARRTGRVRGEARILLLEDGRMLVDFDGLLVDTQRCRDVGLLEPMKEPYGVANAGDAR